MGGESRARTPSKKKESAYSFSNSGYAPSVAVAPLHQAQNHFQIWKRRTQCNSRHMRRARQGARRHPGEPETELELAAAAVIATAKDTLQAVKETSISPDTPAMRQQAVASIQVTNTPVRCPWAGAAGAQKVS